MNSGNDVANPLVRREISDTELGKAFEGSALFSNRFYVTPTAHGFRIAFCEASPPVQTPHFRCAVIIGLDDALALKAVLEDQIEAMMRQIGQQSVVSATI